MDEIDALINDIKSIIDKTAQGATQQHQSDNIINLELLQNREHSINKLLKIKQFLGEANIAINTKITHAKKMQTGDIKKIDQVMNGFKESNSWKNKLMMNMPPHTSTASADATAPPVDAAPPAAILNNAIPTAAATAIPTAAANTPKQPLPITVPPARLAPQPMPTSRVYFNDNLYLNAINVSGVKDITDNGKLYYIAEMDHFVLKIDNEIFHGNIGKIYSHQRDPVRVKKCKFTTNCNKPSTCTYYHDPTSHPGKKDIRNFVASSWFYTEPSAPCKDIHHIRRYGSRTNLSADLVNITNEEICLFNDQVFHDMLCMLVLRKYVKNMY